jgi:hypothetical protein
MDALATPDLAPVPLTLTVTGSNGTPLATAFGSGTQLQGSPEFFVNG